MDARRTPSNGRVALMHLKDQVEAEHFTEGTPARVIASEAPLLRSATGAIDKTLLFGEAVIVIEDAPMAFVQSAWDGYVGYVPRDTLGPSLTATHRVMSRSSNLYDRADAKSPVKQALSIGSEVAVTGSDGGFAQIPDGFIPVAHLAALDETRPITQTAQSLIDAPYVWGGNASTGLDCSGLVQLCLRLAGKPCPRDSDQQCAEVGQPLPEDAPLHTDDLIFWPGHVGIMMDEAQLIHANGHHMAVAIEPLSEAVERIARNDGTQVIARRRP